jgi:hypothetical protein
VVAGLFCHHYSPTLCSTAIAATSSTFLPPPPPCCLLSIVATIFAPLTCTVWLSIPPSCHPFSVTNLHLPSSPLDDQ